jgi:hypothetical protein
MIQFLDAVYYTQENELHGASSTCTSPPQPPPPPPRGEWAEFATSSLTFPISSLHENLFQLPQKTILPPSEIEAVASLSHLLLLDT